MTAIALGHTVVVVNGSLDPVRRNTVRDNTLVGSSNSLVRNGSSGMANL